jgi:hypothetical protein
MGRNYFSVCGGSLWLNNIPAPQAGEGGLLLFGNKKSELLKIQLEFDTFAEDPNSGIFFK